MNKSRFPYGLAKSRWKGWERCPCDNPICRQITRETKGGKFAIVWRREGGYGFGNNWANSEDHARKLAEEFAEKHGGWA